MIVKLFLLFTVVPFVELALLIKLGTIIGALDTVLLIVITGIVGAVLVRAAGVQCLFRIQEHLQAGSFPADELFNGLLILLAGAFLITPGLLTDTAGFCLLVPAVRNVIKGYLQRYVEKKIKNNNNIIRIDMN